MDLTTAVIFTLYRLLSWLLFILLLPAVPLLMLFSRKRRATLLQRLGFFTGPALQDKTCRRLWIHALSVGEVKSAVPLVRCIKQKDHAIQIVFTASTLTGFETARTLFAGADGPLADGFGYFPLDFDFSINRLVKRIDPDAVILVETDLWPNFLYTLKRRQLPVVLVNARLSVRSLKGFLRFKPVFSRVFSFLAMIFAQTRLDQERYLALGVDSEKIRVSGNIKFDQPVMPSDQAVDEQIREALGIQPHFLVVLAGSTHQGEEAMLLDWYIVEKQKTPALVLVIVPRDPGRSEQIQKMIQAAGQDCVLMSEHKVENAVIVVDRMGELSRLYSICDIAFVGGSLVDEGGHNPLEPAACSKPVLFGPCMSDFKQISQLLTDGGGALCVASSDELAQALTRLLAEPALCHEMGHKNQLVFSAHSGAVKAVVSSLEQMSIV